MANGFGFSRPEHLLKTDDISSVFSFNRRFGGEYFQVLVKPCPRKPVRLAVIVGKKIVRLAVMRNYIKRTVRELVRLQQHELAGLDIVVRVRKLYSREEYAAVSPELRAHLLRAQLAFSLHQQPGVS